jgi:aminopeptidase N
VELAIDANKRQEQRGRDALVTGAEILRFYASIIGDVPYDTFTVAMVEDDTPGGHSPAYFAVLNNPLPIAPFTFRNDPASFADYPEFFLAHEIAHQWWGQAVGWKNYHEQWLSEGLAQYFAALYAAEKRGEQGYRNVLRTLRRWAQDESDQGPVSLGYRLGHVRGDQRVFRALVYNKGAMVLHMLRRLIGEDAFLRGLRAFYAEGRFRKAGTDDLRRAMAAESGRDLDRFFAKWIFDTALPRVRFTTVVDGDTLRIRYEQIGEAFDVPVTVSLQYADRHTEDVVVPVTEASGEHVVPLTGALRTVEINEDNGALGIFEKR